MRRLTLLALALAGLLVRPAPAADCTRVSGGRTPLTDLGTGTYQGYEGGLYPDGANARPAAYDAEGRALAEQIVPRDAAGTPDGGGAIAFLAIGMSNTRIEFEQFSLMALADPLRNAAVVTVNGAQGGVDAKAMRDPDAQYWEGLGSDLRAAGVTASQVQAIWLKQAISHPEGGFPAAAIELRDDLAAILRVIADRFPNARVVYFSNRIYGGYAGAAGTNPEPYAYETSFAVKWLVEDRIEGRLDGVPWISWAADLWADGVIPRSDGLMWLCTDLREDGTHPHVTGATKVALLLLRWLHTDPTAQAWYETA